MNAVESNKPAETPTPGSKADIAYDQVRERILDGTYPPGGRLVLDRIARELSVSTLPVREAIRRLEAEGYVEFRQNVGATVTEVDTSSYIQAVETLAVLEGAATAQAAKKIHSEEIAQMRSLNDEMRRQLDRQNVRLFLDAHDQFHATIAGCCANAHLVGVLSSERTRLQRARSSLISLDPTSGLLDISEHDELIKLIETKAAPEVIEDFSRAHLMRLTESVLPPTPLK